MTRYLSGAAIPHVKHWRLARGSAPFDPPLGLESGGVRGWGAKTSSQPCRPTAPRRVCGPTARLSEVAPRG